MSLSANEIILTNTIDWTATANTFVQTKEQISNNLSETFHRLVEPASTNMRNLSDIYLSFSNIDSETMSTIRLLQSNEELLNSVTMSNLVKLLI